MVLRGTLLVLIGAVIGCSDDSTKSTPPDTIMTTEGYDKTCSADADCVLVFTGSVCGCACTQDAIRLGEQSRYAAEQEEKRKACTEVLICGACPDTQMATCSAGMCNVIAK